MNEKWTFIEINDVHSTLGQSSIQYVTQVSLGLECVQFLINGVSKCPSKKSFMFVCFFCRLNRALSSGRFLADVGQKTSFYTFFPESMHATDVTDEVKINVNVKSKSMSLYCILGFDINVYTIT